MPCSAMRWPRSRLRGLRGRRAARRGRRCSTPSSGSRRPNERPALRRGTAPLGDARGGREAGGLPAARPAGGAPRRWGPLAEFAKLPAFLRRDLLTALSYRFGFVTGWIALGLQAV